MGTDLICRGTLTLGGTDVSDEVTTVIMKGLNADLVIPATLTNDQSHAGGATSYTIQIDYLSDDASTGTLFPILWAAVVSATKEVDFVVRMRPGAESPTNPQWSGTFIVSGADVGGDVETVSVGSITCTMTGAPTLLES